MLDEDPFYVTPDELLSELRERRGRRPLAEALRLVKVADSFVVVSLMWVGRSGT